MLIPCLLILGTSITLTAQSSGTMDQLLELDLTDLMKLEVVTALKEPETLNRVPATVRVITAEDIRSNGYFNLEDVLADLPGFQFRNIVGFNSYSFLRGIPSQNNKILVLVDGIQINELNSGGFYGGAQYNLANVERIEVVYGPASALYGTNAISGIINIITFGPRNAPPARVSATVGNFDTQAADVRISQYDAGQDVGFTLSGMIRTTEKADLKGKEGDDNWTGDMENFEDDLSFDGKFRYKDFIAGFVLQDKDASRATVQQTMGTGLSDHDVDWHIRFLNLWAAYSAEFQKNLRLQSKAYYRNATVLNDTVPITELAEEDFPGRQYRYYRPGNLLGNETQISWTPRTGYRLTLGMVLEREHLADQFSITTSDSAEEEPPVPPDPDMMTNTLVSVFAQGRIALSDSAELFLGLRHDDSSYYGTVDTPRVGLVINRKKLTTKILMMDAFRAPRPWDYTDGMGNSDLQPEKMRSYEISNAWSFSDHVRLEGSLYHNNLDNLLVREIVNEGSRWINAGEVNTNGFEISLDYRKGPWKGYLNATYTDSEDEMDEQVPEIAPWGANLGFHYAFSASLSAGIRGNYLGTRDNPRIIPATGDMTIEDAWVFHGFMTMKLRGGFDLQLVINNLFDTEYYHPSNLPPTRFRQPQRTFRITGGFFF
ncbi:MAG TPA: TonB-dependent receptor [Thermoanaerobaculia bacterium]|nr:TonB-dependent receptor [Thermoanaerobaculia bacterium]